VKQVATKYNQGKARQFFDSLKPAGETNWDSESILKFYETIEVDYERDIVVFHILDMMQVESGEEIRFAEFENGCKAVGCDDAASWKQALPRL
jgi:hypothetical protein